MGGLASWGLAFGLMLFGGMMSGLTLGLLSIEDLELSVIERSGDEREKAQAAKVRGLLRNPHLLLVTLLLCNACAMEALPLVLDTLVEPAVAIMLSVTGVLLFGEIIPQAICKTFGLAVGAAAAPIVKCLLVVCCPIAWPIGKILDCALGRDHGTVYRRPQMAAVVDIHTEQGHLTRDEAAVMQGALDLAQKRCLQCMTPFDNVKALGSDAKMDSATMDWVLKTGYSRIPVVGSQPGTFLGVILIKKLLKLRPDDEVPVSQLELNPIIHISASLHLYELLHMFQTGRSHMAAVYPEGVELPYHDRPPSNTQAIGILTLEDLLEELLKEEIVDETDQYVDVVTERDSAQDTRGSFVPFGMNDGTPRKMGLMNMLARANSMSSRAASRGSDPFAFGARPDSQGVPTRTFPQRIRRASPMSAPNTFPPRAGSTSLSDGSPIDSRASAASLSLPFAGQQHGQ